MVFFKSSAPSWKPKVLNLVHSDVCGPMKTKYFGGESFFDFHWWAFKKIVVISYEDERSGDGIFQAFCGTGWETNGEEAEVYPQWEWWRVF